MIWATVSSWSCFCWLYRASSSSTAKNIVSLISVLTIWWCPCVESSLVLLEREFAMTSAFSRQESISLALLHFVLQGQICLSLQVSLDFLLLHSSLLCCWKRVFAMTSAFSRQNSISLCPASFCTPRTNLPVTPGISWLPTFAFRSPIMKRTSFLVLVLEGLGSLHRTVQLQLLQH